jgi:predicted ABC-type ATPase
MAEPPVLNNPKNITYPYVGSLNEKEAEMIFTAGKGFDGLSTPDEPIFVLLYGTPGSGKSTALKRMDGLAGLDPADAVQINLDSLIEVLEPFRLMTAKIAFGAFEEKGIENINSSNQATVAEIAGKASAPYLSIMRSKKNNRPGHEGEVMKYNILDLRLLMLDLALKAGKNIIYERTVSDSKKDILGPEVFEKIKASGHPYKVFVIYTKIDDEEVLKERLRMRPLSMLKRNPPFFRGVPSTLAKKFITAHEEYFRNFLEPRIAAGEVKGRVVFWDGRGDLFMNGGNRRKTRSNRRKSYRKTRHCRSNR